jgi:phosphoadenosine phosphosulfate reductase
MLLDRDKAQAAAPPVEAPKAPHDVAAFTERLAHATPPEIVAAAAHAMPGGLAVVSSFGTESAVLLKFVADVDRSLPVLFLDTLWQFKETLAYRDALVERLGLTDIRTITPSPSALATQDPKNDLCVRDREACCGIRKVEPLANELTAFDGWLSGRKRYHGGERAALPVVEADGPRLKFNPLAPLTRAELNGMFAAARLPRHPLEAIGFSSIGCVPCTHRPAAGAGLRDGRWSGLGKTECGIHSGPLRSPAG